MLDESGEEGLQIDVRVDLPDEDGEKRSINVLLPWDDLVDAVEFLKGTNHDQEADHGS